MNNRTYYKLTFEKTYFEEYLIDFFFFKTREEAEAKKREIENEVDYCEINEVSFSELKCNMTINYFEEFFGVSIADLLEGIED